MASDSHAPGALVPAAAPLCPGGDVPEGPGLLERIRAAWLISLTSANTRDAYRHDFALWEEFLAEVAGVDALAARRAHVDAWARTLTEVAREAPSTRARRLAAVSAFYAFAADFAEEHGLELEVHNPAGMARRPRVDNSAATRALDKGEYRALLEAAAAEPPVWGARDAAVVALLGLGGYRVSTLVAMTVDDLGVQGAHRTVSYTVKGGKRKTAALAPITLAYLNDHLEARRALGPHMPGEPLVLANSGGRLSRDQVGRILARCARRAGLTDPGGVTPHVLRATYGTLGERAGISIWDLQDGMDHSDPRTTQGYVKRAKRLENAPTYRLSNFILSD